MTCTKIDKKYRLSSALQFIIPDVSKVCLLLQGIFWTKSSWQSNAVYPQGGIQCPGEILNDSKVRPESKA